MGEDGDPKGPCGRLAEDSKRRMRKVNENRSQGSSAVEFNRVEFVNGYRVMFRTRCGRLGSGPKSLMKGDQSVDSKWRECPVSLEAWKGR